MVSSDFMDTAIELTRGAGRIVREAFDSGVTVEHKGPVDLVTEADRASEDYLLRAIAREFGNHAVWAEESGKGAQEGPWRWVIDPLDGTVNFAHGVPHFAVLVAVQERQGADYQTQLGIVLDPMRDELFVAVRGQGAWRNGRPLAVSSTRRLIDATLATGFAYERLFTERDNHREFCRLNLVSQGVRRFGSAGLDFAYLACGRFDGFWEWGLKPWDVAAGVLLVEEAGGTVTGLAGEPFELSRGEVLATNGPLHQPLKEALDSAREHPINSREGLAELLPPELAERLSRES